MGGSAPPQLCIFLLVLGVYSSQADVVVRNLLTNATVSFDSAPASFGRFDMDMSPGRLVEVLPYTACNPNITRPPMDPNNTFIAIVSRGECAFVTKVLNAQKMGYVGVVVVNYKNKDLLMMGGETSDIIIPSVLTSYDAGRKLRGQYLYKDDPKFAAVLNTNYEPFSWHNYLFPFIVVVGVCLVLMGVFMLIRYRRDRIQSRQRRLPAVDLKRIPTIKFKKSEESRYETCAICLDDYENGDKLRVLPCEHAYHCQCIDKWLVSRSRACPVCKAKVQPGDNDTPPPTRRRPTSPSGAGNATASSSAATALISDDDSEDALSIGDQQDERLPFVQSLDRSGGRYGSSAANSASPPSSTSPCDSRHSATVVEVDATAGPIAPSQSGQPSEESLV